MNNLGFVDQMVSVATTPRCCWREKQPQLIRRQVDATALHKTSLTKTVGELDLVCGLKSAGPGYVGDLLKLVWVFQMNVKIKILVDDIIVLSEH